MENKNGRKSIVDTDIDTTIVSPIVLMLISNIKNPAWLVHNILSTVCEDGELTNHCFNRAWSLLQLKTWWGLRWRSKRYRDVNDEQNGHHVQIPAHVDTSPSGRLKESCSVHRTEQRRNIVYNLLTEVYLPCNTLQQVIIWTLEFVTKVVSPNSCTMQRT